MGQLCPLLTGGVFAFEACSSCGHLWFLLMWAYDASGLDNRYPFEFSSAA